MKPSDQLFQKKIADFPTQKVSFIVVAAGSGSRYGANLPKQFCLLNGRPVLMTTIERLNSCSENADIIVALNPAFREYWAELCESYGFGVPHRVVDGGDTRSLSVAHALAHVDRDTDAVLIHDGARPVVNAGMVGRLLEALETNSAAIPVVAVTDSLRHISSDEPAGHPVDRSEYVAVQTPQAFRAEAIDALREVYDSGVSATDDATLFQMYGKGRLAAVAGDPHNIKITNPGDIEAAEMYLK